MSLKKATFSERIKTALKMNGITQQELAERTNINKGNMSRYVNGNLTGLAGYAKSTSYISLAEAVINMVLSIVLVQKYGITGVLFATVIALPIKVIWCIYISDKKVLHRSLAKTIQMISCNLL